MTIHLIAHLTDGRTITGPIQGCGGKIGSGCLHVGTSAAEIDALSRLALCQKRAAAGEPLPIYEPEPGCVAIYPEFCAASDGEAEHIPVVGTKFEINRPNG